MNWDYITGFFDADGSITAIRNSAKGSKIIQLSFHNNEINILEEIQEFILKDINVKGSISIKKAKKTTHKDSFELKYRFRNGLEVAKKLKTLHPKKKHRIETYLLIQQKTKRNGKYTVEELKEREKLIEIFFQI